MREVFEFLQEVNFDELGGELGRMRKILGELGVGSGCERTKSFDNADTSTYEHGSDGHPSSHNRRDMSFSSGYGIEAVQAVMTYFVHELISRRKGDLEAVWRLMTCGMGLASGIGLDRDPGLWGMPEKIAQRRRSLFWEMFVMDKMKVSWKLVVLSSIHHHPWLNL